MIKVYPPSRPRRLGTRRRARRREQSEPLRGAVSAGGGHAPAKPAASLDTEKLLKTSVRNWIDDSLTQEEISWQAETLHRRVMQSLFELWQGYERQGDQVNAVKWQKQWAQVRSCQTQWIGFRADCCGSKTRPRAVPIGCNHRLCPLCCWHRSQKARKRVKKLFDRLEHPVMITLTVPNTETIRKHDFTLMRQRVRKLISQHKLISQKKGWIRGGVYALETTYNRQQKTWHLHCHILADLASALPGKQDKVTIRGKRMCRFTAMKRRLEFDWLRLWRSDLGKHPRENASKDAVLADVSRFEDWLEVGERMRTKEFRGGRLLPIEGLSPREFAARTEWNRQYRRVVHIKPVDDREKAALEVLKYITKVAAFSDLPEAIEPFMNAVRGARLIQTFGSWYGVDLSGETDDEPAHSDLHCACGCNDWKRMGLFNRENIEFDVTTGQYFLKLPFDHNSRGTVHRPTIRALSGREE